MKVYKYGVELNDYFEFDMPGGAKILTVQMQNGKPYMWAMVNPEEELQKRTFRMAGIGHSINEREIIGYIGTFQMQDGTLVFHLFEIKFEKEKRDDS